ncbi:MAG: ROK family protein [Acidilobus sp.]
MRAIAVDVGATNLRVALFSGGNIIRLEKAHTPRTSGGDLINSIIGLIKRVAPSYEFEAIGVASIGPLDLRKGLLLWSPNLGYGNVELRDAIGEEFRRMVYLANDAMAGVWAEKVLGKGKETSDLAYITMSTGLGVGAVVDGNLLVGRRGNAHELGHAVVNFESDLPCGCGGRGHWEVFVGGKNIPRVAQRLAEGWTGEPTEAHRQAIQGSLTPEILYSMARQGDKFANHVVDYLNRVHAAGIMTIIAAYDPEVIFIGGSIYLYNEDLIRPGVLRHLERYAGVFGIPRIERCSFEDDQVLYGAASIAMNPPDPIARNAYKP